MSTQDLGHRNGVVGIVIGLSGEWTADREGGVFDDEIVGGLFEFAVGAKSEVVVLVLRRGVHPTALVTVERKFFVIAGDDVLSQFGADRLQQLTEVPDHREIPQDRVPPLGEIVDEHQQQAATDRNG